MRGAMPAEPDNSYVIRFTALGAQVLPDEAADLLREALDATPGTGTPGDAPATSGAAAADRAAGAFRAAGPARTGGRHRARSRRDPRPGRTDGVGGVPAERSPGHCGRRP